METLKWAYNLYIMTTRVRIMNMDIALSWLACYITFHQQKKKLVTVPRNPKNPISPKKLCSRIMVLLIIYSMRIYPRKKPVVLQKLTHLKQQIYFINLERYVSVEWLIWNIRWGHGVTKCRITWWIMFPWSQGSTYMWSTRFFLEQENKYHVMMQLDEQATHRECNIPAHWD